MCDELKGMSHQKGMAGCGWGFAQQGEFFTYLHNFLSRIQDAVSQLKKCLPAMQKVEQNLRQTCYNLVN